MVDVSARRRSPYWPVLAHPTLRRVWPGFAVSYLGDGMAAVAVSWLAIELAPAGQRGAWVAVALAAYTLPGAVGTVLFARLARGRSGAQLAGWDAVLRAAALGAVPLLALVGALDIGVYVGLLAVSSLLHVWGSAGRYTLLAETLPARHHLAANALVGTLGEVGTIVGPVAAGLILTRAGAATVIAVDAATFAVLAATYRLAVPPRPAAPTTGAADARHATDTGDIAGAGDGGDGADGGDGGGAAGAEVVGRGRSAGFRVILGNRTLLGLLALTVVFFFLYGPVEVALPLYVAQDLHRSAGLLAAYWTVFGVGAVAGGIVAGHLGRWPPWPTTIGIVLGWGASLLPLALGAPLWLSIAGFGAGGLIYAPYQAVSMALFQRAVPTGRLPAVLAARGAAAVLATPAGTVLGGPLVAAAGPRGALLASALATLALGAVAAAAALRRRR